MADTKGRVSVKLVDPTTAANEAAVTAAGALRVDVAATAAALGDATANPTTSFIEAFNATYNGTTWDRMRSVAAAQDTIGTGIAAAGILGQLDDTATATVTENQFAPVRISTRRALLVEGVASGTNLNVAIAASSATVTVDTELPAAAALSDTTANPTTSMIGAAGMLWDGSTNWIRAKSAATLADALANPGAGLAQSQPFLMGFNGTTWDRVRTANTGRLQVDVVTGGGSDTPTNPVLNYQTSAALAAAASANLDTPEATSKKLRSVDVWSSVPFKVALQTIDNAVPSANKVVGGGVAAQAWNYKTPHRNYITLGATAGLDAFRAVVTNLDQTSAADVYATFMYED